MRVVVFGGRDYKDKAFQFSALDQFHKETPISLLIEGGAQGADRNAREWGMSRGVYPATLWALWDVLGNSAGPLRNIAIKELLYPDQGIAFPGGKGTNHMYNILKEAGIPVLDLR